MKTITLILYLLSTVHTQPTALSGLRLIDKAGLTIENELRTDSLEAESGDVLPFHAEIVTVAKKYKLPPALLAAIVQEESRFDEFAVRTERSYLKKRKVITEANAFSKSHGGLAREQGFDARYLSELILPLNSLESGAKHLQSLLIKYKKDTLSAISAYNQGNNRKRHGLFANARYVYRVSVAWKFYTPYFSQSNSTGYNYMNWFFPLTSTFYCYDYALR